MSDLRCAMFEQNRCQDTLDISWENFKGSCMEICNKHAPIKSYKVRDRVNPSVDSDIIIMMYKRDYVHRKAILLKDSELWAEYKKLRNKVAHEIKRQDTKMRFNVMVIEMEYGTCT